MLSGTEGIIARTIPFGEADLIVSAFTREGGIMKFFAKSPRKIKSRFGSALEPFTHIRLEYWGKEHTQLPKLTRADIVRPFQRLRENLELYVTAAEAMEMTITLLPEREPARELFEYLLDTLGVLEKEAGPSLRQKMHVLCYKIKLLGCAGFSPRLSGCGRCARTSKVFYLSEGAVLCSDCAQKLAHNGTGRAFLLSQGSVNLYETIRKWQWTKLGRLFPSVILIGEIERMINLHLKYCIEKTMKTRYFMEKTGLVETVKARDLIPEG